MLEFGTLDRPLGRVDGDAKDWFGNAPSLGSNRARTIDLDGCVDNRASVQELVADWWRVRPATREVDARRALTDDPLPYRRRSRRRHIDGARAYAEGDALAHGALVVACCAHEHPGLIRGDPLRPNDCERFDCRRDPAEAQKVQRRTPLLVGCGSRAQPSARTRTKGERIRHGGECSRGELRRRLGSEAVKLVEELLQPLPAATGEPLQLWPHICGLGLHELVAERAEGDGGREMLAVGERRDLIDRGRTLFERYTAGSDPLGGRSSSAIASRAVEHPADARPEPRLARRLVHGIEASAPERVRPTLRPEVRCADAPASLLNKALSRLLVVKVERQHQHESARSANVLTITTNSAAATTAATILSTGTTELFSGGEGVRKLRGALITEQHLKCLDALRPAHCRARVDARQEGTFANDCARGELTVLHGTAAPEGDAALEHTVGRSCHAALWY